MYHLNSGQRFRLKKNDDSHSRCNTNSQIKFKATMLESSSCDYSDGYMYTCTCLYTFLLNG